jgi:phage shock protein PspC (stress-responsive transcriptional regulator)
MRLTQRQEAVLTRYVREVNAHLDGALPDRVRERLLRQLQQQLWEELLAFDREVPEDGQVWRVLQRFGAPEYQATMLVSQRESGEWHLPAEGHVWLGVCAGIATRLATETWVVRAFALILGCTTGPVALLLYLAAYGVLYAKSEDDTLPRADKRRVFGYAFSAMLVAVALHAGTLLFIRAVYFVHGAVLHRALPQGGSWNWLDARSGELLFYVLACAVPVAVLSALPLAGGWERSLKRAWQTILALYGVLLAFGAASIIVGLILDFVHEVARTAPH